MQEIKFRAWDKICNPPCMKSWGQLLAQYQLTQVFTCGNDHFELMQFTGKHDDKRTTEFPKGQEIYQGDIVNVEYLNNGELQREIIEVSLSKDGQGYSPFNWEYICDGCDCGLSIESVEVIGNIYENKSLLEEK
jgi:uncharacterized phage protein (TIGR01671 family)